jgi:hypothetical protein
VAARPQQHRLLVLAVDMDEVLAQLGQDGERDRAAVDVNATLAAARQVATDEHLVVVHPEAERVAQMLRQRTLEQPLHQCFIGLAANEIGAAAGAAQQRERLQQDALARSGLAGDHVQTAAEGDRKVIDDGDVADAQLAQHARLSSRCGHLVARRAQRSPQRNLLRRTPK